MNREESLRAAALEREELRRKARGSLIAFAQYVKDDYQPAWFHREIAAKLEAVERGEIKRLLICMPPQHGKSALSSVLFPAWFLGRNPKSNFACCSYSSPLALKHSREARDVFTSKAYREVFPEARHQPSRAGQRAVAIARQAAHEWGTHAGGTVRAVGVGGSLTGYTVHLGLIDDPHKDRAEANSETVRAGVAGWYDSTFLTRLTMTQGPVVLVYTRWHPEDLGGLLLEAEAKGGEKWEKVIYKALTPQDDGTEKALWPERVPASFLRSIRKSYEIKGALHEWESLYQQEPVLPGGNRFATTEIVIHDSIDDFPKGGRWAWCWDLASSEKQRGTNPDFTVGVKGTGTIDTVEIKDEPTGKVYTTQVENIWISDLRFMRKEAPERNAAIKETAIQDDLPIWVEAFGAYKDAYVEVRDALKGIRRVVKAQLPGDKSQKAAPLESVIATGRFHILRADWNAFLLKQLREFPEGAKDDAVDACALLYHATVGRYITPGVSRATKEEEPDEVVEAIKRAEEDGPKPSVNERIANPDVWRG